MERCGHCGAPLDDWDQIETHGFRDCVRVLKARLKLAEERLEAIREDIESLVEQGESDAGS